MPESINEQYQRISSSQNIRSVDNSGNISQDKTNQFLIEEPFNETDPFVVFDPNIPKPVVPQDYVSGEEQEIAFSDVEKVKVDGIDYPLLVINSMAVDPKLISFFKFSLRGFLPELEFTINDPNKIFEASGTPGLTNIVIAVMTPQFNGIYRKISMAFYIKERLNDPNDLTKYTFKCEYRCFGLNNELVDQVGTQPLTTFEMCANVAKRCGLGFAATNKCKDVNDKRWRQIHGKTLSKFIQDQVDGGGTDSDTIFDSWVDSRGYLVLVNLKYVFTADIKPNNLVIGERLGTGLPTPETVGDSGPFRTIRLLSNFNDMGIKDLFITEYYPSVSTENAMNSGTANNYWYLVDVGGSNIMVRHDTQTVENTFDGKNNIDLYKFAKTKYIGAAMSNTPEILQKRFKKLWIDKYRSKKLIVRLLNISFGLERGTLVNVLINETDRVKMAQIARNADNVLEENPVEPGSSGNIDDDAGPNTTQSELTEANSLMMNPVYTGLYYIDGIEYHYAPEYDGFIQFLILIKVSIDNPLFGLSAGQSVNTEEADIITRTIPESDPMFHDAYNNAHELLSVDGNTNSNNANYNN